jgi:hypothetical protein
MQIPKPVLYGALTATTTVRFIADAQNIIVGITWTIKKIIQIYKEGFPKDTIFSGNGISFLRPRTKLAKVFIGGVMVIIVSRLVTKLLVKIWDSTYPESKDSIQNYEKDLAQDFVSWLEKNLKNA